MEENVYEMISGRIQYLEHRVIELKKIIYEHERSGKNNDEISDLLVELLEKANELKRLDNIILSGKEGD